ncbi:MAG: hypothetical protein MJK10_19070 [Pseudomonadales bacterium]|nr:hypothetical protein [Pseudomonadales bacterium]NRA18389.1 hypothetical protein [Oceanospirillaceae bacterium]
MNVKPSRAERKNHSFTQVEKTLDEALKHSEGLTQQIDIAIDSASENKWNRNLEESNSRSVGKTERVAENQEGDEKGSQR